MTEDEKRSEERIECFVMRELARAYERELRAVADDAAAAMLSGSGSMYAAHLDIMREIADRMIAAEEVSDRAFKWAFNMSLDGPSS